MNALVDKMLNLSKTVFERGKKNNSRLKKEELDEIKMNFINQQDRMIMELSKQRGRWNRVEGKVNDTMKVIYNTLDKIVDNLTVLVTKSSNHTETKILRLQTLLKSVTINLKLLKNKVMQTNEWINKDTWISLVSATQKLRQDVNELQNLTILTSRNLSLQCRRWNFSDAEVEDILSLIRQQNETLKFVALSTKIKHIKQKQFRFENKTRRDQLDLRQALKKSELGCKKMIEDEIEKAKTSFQDSFENTNDVNLKVGEIDTKFQKKMTSISNKQKTMENDLSQAKGEFQGKDREHDQAISDFILEVQGLKSKLTNLQSSLDKKTDDISTISDQLASANSNNIDLKKRVKTLEESSHLMTIALAVCSGVIGVLALISMIYLFCKCCN